MTRTAHTSFRWCHALANAIHANEVWIIRWALVPPTPWTASDRATEAPEAEKDWESLLGQGPLGSEKRRGGEGGASLKLCSCKAWKDEAVDFILAGQTQVK
jgi:hypothetical protein